MESLTKSHQAVDFDALHQEFNQEGYVIIDQLFSEETMQQVLSVYDVALRAKMERLGIKPVDADQSDQGRVGLDFRPEGGNHDQNRWNMHLPSTLPFLAEEIFANAGFLSLLHRILGPDCVNIMLASDTPFPGASFQSYHQDFHRQAVTVNIALKDVTEEDSPLEVVPKTHRAFDKHNALQPYTSENVKHSDSSLQWAITNMPSKRLTARAGSVVIRDQRMIHRGTAHNGTSYRPLLALWYKQAPTKVDISKVTTPVPHRTTANRVAAKALSIRNEGRQKGNKKVINAGSLLGRLVDEASCTDRDYRRVIPQEIWNAYSPAAKQLLRYAEVEGRSEYEQYDSLKRSKKGDTLLSMFSGAASLYKTFV